MIVRGIGVEQTREGADEPIDTLAQEYFGQDNDPFRRPAQQRSMRCIKPHHGMELGVE